MANLLGTKRADALAGSDSDDAMSGGRGNDEMFGGRGADVMFGGAGQDVMYGGTGNDKMYAGAGNDILVGGNKSTSIPDLTKFVIKEDVSAKITFNGELAGYKNTLGMYTIGADGSIQNVKVLWANASEKDSGGKLVADKSSVSVDLKAGERVGFFVVPNAFDQPGMEKLLTDPNGSWKMLDRGSGLPANVGWGATKLVHVDKKGHETEIKSAYGTDVFHSASNGSGWLNPDQFNHAKAQVDGVSGTVKVGFEDLWNGGDRDFDDASFTIDIGSANAMQLPKVSTGPAKVSTAADDDLLKGGAGNDKLFGGAGNDTLHGGAGNDEMFGGAGNDVLRGGRGNDKMYGGSGDDAIFAGSGNDYINGGSGFDTVDFSNIRNGVRVDLNAHKSSGGAAGSDSLWGIEKVIGTSFADSISGDKRGNTLVGGDGDDELRGRGGADVLNGGAGKDTFVWYAKDVTGGAADHITDFQVGDKVDLHFMYKGLAGSHSDMVRLDDKADGLHISAKIGGAFVEVVVLDGLHGSSVSDLMKSGALLV